MQSGYLQAQLHIYAIKYPNFLIGSYAYQHDGLYQQIVVLICAE